MISFNLNLNFNLDSIPAWSHAVSEKPEIKEYPLLALKVVHLHISSGGQRLRCGRMTCWPGFPSHRAARHRSIPRILLGSLLHSVRCTCYQQITERTHRVCWYIRIIHSLRVPRIHSVIARRCVALTSTSAIVIKSIISRISLCAISA